MHLITATDLVVFNKEKVKTIDSVHNNGHTCCSAPSAETFNTLKESKPTNTGRNDIEAEQRVNLHQFHEEDVHSDDNLCTECPLRCLYV
jgi:hypothetical protein